MCYQSFGSWHWRRRSPTPLTEMHAERTYVRSPWCSRTAVLAISITSLNTAHSPATDTTSPVSSRNSRATACWGCSPWSTPPPGNDHAPGKSELRLARASRMQPSFTATPQAAIRCRSTSTDTSRASHNTSDFGRPNCAIPAHRRRCGELRWCFCTEAQALRRRQVRVPVSNTGTQLLHFDRGLLPC